MENHKIPMLKHSVCCGDTEEKSVEVFNNKLNMFPSIYYFNFYFLRIIRQQLNRISIFKMF